MIKGIIAYRGWEVKDDCILNSPIARYRWLRPIARNSAPPEIGSRTGFYACIFESPHRSFHSYEVNGIVELRGEILLHTDGIIRASWCKILELFIPEYLGNPSAIQALHVRYGVTMTVTNDMTKTISRWADNNQDKIAASNALIAKLGKTPNEVYMPPCVVREHYDNPQFDTDNLDNQCRSLGIAPVTLKYLARQINSCPPLISAVEFKGTPPSLPKEKSKFLGIF